MLTGILFVGGKAGAQSHYKGHRYGARGYSARIEGGWNKLIWSKKGKDYYDSVEENKQFSQRNFFSVTDKGYAEK